MKFCPFNRNFWCDSPHWFIHGASSWVAWIFQYNGSRFIHVNACCVREYFERNQFWYLVGSSSHSPCHFCLILPYSWLGLEMFQGVGNGRYSNVNLGGSDGKMTRLACIWRCRWGCVTWRFDDIIDARIDITLYSKIQIDAETTALFSLLGALLDSHIHVGAACIKIRMLQ